MKRSYWPMMCGMITAIALGGLVGGSSVHAQLTESLTGAAEQAAKDAAKETVTEAVKSAAAAAGLATDATRQFTVVNVLYEGSKMFVPSFLAVSKGDKVSITVMNNIPGDPPNHGFSIPAFGVETVVNHGEKKTVEFTADKAGIFDIKCQLHPAHVSGQLLVQE